jgi:hypothetical protein
MNKIKLSLILIALQTPVVSIYANVNTNDLSQQINELQAQINQIKTSKQPNLNIGLNKTAFKTILSGSAAYPEKTTSVIKMISNNTIQTGATAIGGKLEGVGTYNSNFISPSYDLEKNSNLSFQGQIGVISKPSDIFSLVMNFSAKNAGDVSTKQMYGVLGNLSYSPLYMIAGYKYIDFGYMARYSNNIANFNRSFNSTNAAQVEIGLIKNNLSAMITAFNGDSDTYTNTNQVSNAAANITYSITPTDNLSGSIGAGVIKGINNNSTLINGQPITLSVKRAPAWDIFKTLEYNFSNKSKLTAYVEYIQASRNGFNSTKPSSLSTSVAYNFTTKGWNLIPSFSYSYLLGTGLDYNATTPSIIETSSINQYVLSLATYLGPVKVGVDYGRLIISKNYNDQVGILKAEYLF